MGLIDYDHFILEVHTDVLPDAGGQQIVVGHKDKIGVAMPSLTVLEWTDLETSRNGVELLDVKGVRAIVLSLDLLPANFDSLVVVALLTQSLATQSELKTGSSSLSFDILVDAHVVTRTQICS